MGCTTSSWNEVKEVQLSEKLTERQIQVIRDTWDLIADDMERTGLLIFNRLFQTDKELKALFVRLNASSSSAQVSETTGAGAAAAAAASEEEDGEEELAMDGRLLRRHAHVVMEALGAAVECLEDSVFLSSVLVSLGQIHYTYQVRPHLLPRLWPAIRYGLHEVLQDVFTEEVEETWKIVFTYIISKMREGIRAERRNAEGAPHQSTAADDTTW